MMAGRHAVTDVANCPGQPVGVRRHRATRSCTARRVQVGCVTASPHPVHGAQTRPIHVGENFLTSDRAGEAFAESGGSKRPSVRLQVPVVCTLAVAEFFIGDFPAKRYHDFVSHCLPAFRRWLHEGSKTRVTGAKSSIPPNQAAREISITSHHQRKTPTFDEVGVF